MKNKLSTCIGQSEHQLERYPQVSPCHNLCLPRSRSLQINTLNRWRSGNRAIFNGHSWHHVHFTVDSLSLTIHYIFDFEFYRFFVGFFLLLFSPSILYVLYDTLSVEHSSHFQHLCSLTHSSSSMTSVVKHWLTWHFRVRPIPLYRYRYMFSF